MNRKMPALDKNTRKISPFFFLKTKTDYIDKFWMSDHTYNHNQDYKENFGCMIKIIITN